MNGVHETSPEGANRADEPIKVSTTERAAIALSGCPAMDVLRKRGKGLSPGGGMCDRLVGPDLTHHNDAPAHPQAAAQEAWMDERRGLQTHGGRWYQRAGIALKRVDLQQQKAHCAGF